MTQLLLFIRAVAPLIYGLAAIGILLGIRSFWIAKSRLAIAQFRLEREQGEEQGGRAITQTVALIQVIALVFVLSSVTYPAWNEFNSNSPNAEGNNVSESRFRTAVPQQGEEGFTEPTRAIEGITIPRTPKPSPTFSGTVQPASDPVGCLADQANIDTPDNGQVIYEVQPISGTANIQNFGFYRFEIRKIEVGASEAFGVIGDATTDHSTPVVNGPLGSLVPQNFTPGEYRFRLVVFDTGGVLRASCEITIFISEPPPTPTPIGASVPLTPTP